MARRTFRIITLVGLVLLFVCPINAVSATQAVDAPELMQINVKDVPVQEVLKLISESAGINIAIAPGVSGKVTLYMSDMAPHDLLDIVVGLIDVAYVDENGAVLVMTKDTYENRYGQKFLNKLKSKTFFLNNAKVMEVTQSIRALLGKNAEVTPDPVSNSLHIRAGTKKLAEAEKLLKSLDQPMETRSYRVKNVPVGVIQKNLQNLLSSKVKYVEDEFNQRLLVSATAFELDQINRVIELLDMGERLASATLNVKYIAADTLATKLEPHLTQGVGKIFPDNGSGKIIVDDFPSVLERIKHLAKEFDVPNRQVLLEARIVQVSIKNNIKSGVDWSVVQDKVNMTGTFPVLSNTDPGLRGDLGDLSSQNYQVIVQALQEYGNTKLLSSPRLVVADGGKGMIHVGSSVPYKTIDTRETSSGTLNQFEKVTIIDVGVKLEVEVKLFGDDMVSLKVRPEVSSVTGYSDGVPIIDSSTVDSTLMVKNGNTVILGGLIKEENREVRNGVPILSSIPILKYLFSSVSNEKIKGELVILLTPHIMTGREEYVEKGLVGDE